jgi:hypothetical protein
MERLLIPREGSGSRKLETGRLFVAPTISDVFPAPHQWPNLKPITQIVDPKPFPSMRNSESPCRLVSPDRIVTNTGNRL